MGFKEKLEKYKELAKNLEILKNRLNYNDYSDKKEMRMEKLTISYIDGTHRRYIEIELKGGLSEYLLPAYIGYARVIQAEIKDIKNQIEELERGE